MVAAGEYRVTGRSGGKTHRVTAPNTAPTCGARLPAGGYQVVSGEITCLKCQGVVNHWTVHKATTPDISGWLPVQRS
jgi:hypothetical protein